MDSQSHLTTPGSKNRVLALRRDIELEKLPFLVENKAILESVNREMAVLAKRLSQLEETSRLSAMLVRLEELRGKITRFCQDMDELIEGFWSVIGELQAKPDPLPKSYWQKVQFRSQILFGRTETIKNEGFDLHTKILDFLPGLRQQH